MSASFVFRFIHFECGFFRNTVLKFCIGALFAAFCLASLSHAAPWHEIKWVIDGDTIILTDGRHVRLIGIDAPEIENRKKGKRAEPYGDKAKTFLQSLTASKKVRLVLDKDAKDHYGRTLAYVYLPDGTMANEAMIENGYAHCLYKKPNIKFQKQLLKAQRRAMKKQVGMWRQWQEKGQGGYLGNSRSRRFHRRQCDMGRKTSKKNQVMLNTQWDAYWRGYAPCGHCLVGGIKQ